MGAIIGVAEVADVVILNETLDQNPWAIGPYCWLLKNARLIAKPITLKGKLNLFSLSGPISAKLQSQLSEPPPSRDQETVQAYLEAVRPKELDACFSRALTYGELREFPSGIKNCTTIIDQDPSHSEAHRIRAALHNYSGDHISALADCERAIQIADNNAMAYYVRALVHKNLGNSNESIRDHLKARELDPSVPELE